MSKENEKAGMEFERILGLSPFKKSEFARLMGVENPQNITHWYKRGVPAKFANKAAQLLECEPEQISVISLGGELNMRDANSNDELKKEIRARLLDVLSRTDDRQLLELMADQTEIYYKRLQK